MLICKLSDDGSVSVDCFNYVADITLMSFSYRNRMGIEDYSPDLLLGLGLNGTILSILLSCREAVDEFGVQ